MDGRVYKHPKGMRIFVCDGLGGAWATYFRKPNGALKRLVSPSLPVRATAEEAQADLDITKGVKPTT